MIPLHYISLLIDIHVHGMLANGRTFGFHISREKPGKLYRELIPESRRDFLIPLTDLFAGLALLKDEL